MRLGLGRGRLCERQWRRAVRRLFPVQWLGTSSNRLKDTSGDNNNKQLLHTVRQLVPKGMVSPPMNPHAQTWETRSGVRQV